MTANKHTPQDWLRGGTTVYALNAEGTNRFSAQVQGGWSTSGRNRTEPAELEANARLIAAAPELLEALSAKVNDAEQRVFEDWLESKSPSGDHEQVQRQWLESSEYRDFVAEWGDQLAAIAKATGGAA